MHSKIKELITQAGGHWNHGDFNMPSSVEFQEQDIEYFAELIVGECMNQVKEQYTHVIEDEAMMNDEHWKGYKHCGVDSVVAIREHFYGVEE